MGFKDWIKSDLNKSKLMMQHYELGCEVLGEPAGGWWNSSLPERTARINAGRKEAERRASYPAPTRDDGYYSESDSTGRRIGQFFGPNGNLTSERPHIHVIHNEHESRIIFTVTQRNGQHTNIQYLPITASGNDVNAMIDRLRRELR